MRWKLKIIKKKDLKLHYKFLNILHLIDIVLYVEFIGCEIILKLINNWWIKIVLKKLLNLSQFQNSYLKL